MKVSNSDGSHLALPPVLGAVIAVAGMGALVGTSWDDAWHTDLGRDSAWIPPHLLLYGSVAVVGVIVAAWGLRVLVATRSPRAVLRHRPLLVAGIGGAATLAAAPVDGWWHQAFGRDAVLWSPPHMLVIFASAAMVTGVLAGLRGARPPLVAWLLGGLLLGDLAASVIEYDTDVPQFSGVFYLPVLLAAGLLATALVRRLVGGRFPVTGMVAVYVVLRLATAIVLLLLGRSTPVLPVAVLGLALADLPWRRWPLGYAAAAAGVSTLALAASVTGAATEPAAEVAVVALPVLAVFGLLVLAGSRRGRPLALAAGTLLLAVLPLSTARPAAAHDAGEGPPVRPVTLTGTSDGHRTLSLTAQLTGPSCATPVPVRIVARRAGQTRTAPLRHTTGCRYTGTVQVPTGDRWFIYAELRDGTGDLEAWLPLDASRTTTTTQRRDLYRPAHAGATRTTEITAGTLLYAAGLALLALPIWLAAPTRTAKPSRTRETALS